MNRPTDAELLASYVPRFLRKRALADPATIDVAIKAELRAVAFFVDISGFSTLTESLAVQGPRGVETLADILNGCFGPMIDIIYRYGGDVVKIAGDAMLAIWPIASETTASPPSAGSKESQVILRAAKCALAIADDLRDVRLENRALRFKMAIAFGDLTEVHLGGVDGRWEFLFAGDPLVELGAANDQANPADILICPSAFALVNDHVECVPLPEAVDTEGPVRLVSILSEVPAPQASAPLVVSDDAIKVLRPYIPASVIDRVLSGQSDWLAEFRNVTVALVHLRQPDQVLDLDRAQLLTHTIQHIVHRFEGTLNKISQDDKGIMFDAAFGLPPFSHNDDPIRGIRAGMEIAEQLSRLGIRCAVGVSTGEVFCGSVGNRERQIYTFLGASVNLAARLTMLGDQLRVPTSQGNPVRCDEVTFSAARDRVRFERLETQPIKGVSHLVAVFRPIAVYRPIAGRGSSSPRPARLIGRTEQKRVSMEALARLSRDGRSSAIVIRGGGRDREVSARRGGHPAGNRGWDPGLDD